jgi:FkbM family methyltransferase
MKKLLNSFLKKFGYRISRIPPFEGLDVFEFQKYLFKNINEELIIFDVGACRGEVALIYNRLFPDSLIYCFEPFSPSFNLLNNNISELKNIIAFNKALGSFNGKTVFHSNRSSPTNSILPTNDESKLIWKNDVHDTISTIEAEMVTLDRFISENNIKKIDILKLDVQGSEFMVLEGAKKAIESGIIKVIFAEMITLPTYKNQKNPGEFLELLRSCGFMLYNFYNISLTRSGMLRQMDAIFIKQSEFSNYV